MRVTITRKDGEALGWVSRLGGGGVGYYYGTCKASLTFMRVQEHRVSDALKSLGVVYSIPFRRADLNPEDEFARTSGGVPNLWWVVVPHDRNLTPHLEYSFSD